MLHPGSVLGVLGGGQLGRMFALEAKRLGFRVAVYTPELDSPAAQVADHVTRAEYTDLDRVAAFARSVDGVTFEFENVPAPTAATAAEHTRVRPGGPLLAIAQDRLAEKAAFARLGLPIGPYAPVRRAEDLAAAASAVPGKSVLKTARLGYDGKGQQRLASAQELPQAHAALGAVPCVLEEFVPFVGELSVVGARGADGSVALYEPFRNVHADHILDVTTCPAGLDAAVVHDAQRIARALLEGLDVVGVLCVELFQLADGRLFVNEIAPRPHNSGHLTLDAHVCSQFEQQVRALAGLPLGATQRTGGAGAMANLLGDLWQRGEPDWSAALAIPGVRLHLYGKREARPGRKMGHLCATADDAEAAAALVVRARAALTAGHAVETAAQDPRDGWGGGSDRRAGASSSSG
ncbi:MAG: 5-(carboxyamino)imidazole ribonucleotide synthase [Planctomycetota bacterium]